MSMFRPRRPSPALVISLVALFLAVAGTSYAAFSLPKNSVGTKQLKNGAVTGSKISNGAVTARKLNATGVTVPNALHANSATSATRATDATTADTATNATNATAAGSATTAGNVDGQTFTQINAPNQPTTTLLSNFGGLTLRCTSPGSSSGTVTLSIVNASSNSANFAAGENSSTASFEEGPVAAAVGSVPATTNFTFGAVNGAQVTFSYESASGGIVTGTFAIVLSAGDCTAFGNAEAS